jgi:hypothetical protein
VASGLCLPLRVLWTSVGMNCTASDVGLKATKAHKSLNSVLTSNKTQHRYIKRDHRYRYTVMFVDFSPLMRMVSLEGLSKPLKTLPSIFML